MLPTHLYASAYGPRKILVVDLGFLGDTVHLVPALWNLKEAYPQANLHVLTSPVGAELLKLVRCVDRSWSIELYPEKRTLREQWHVVRCLRREGFDLAFNFSGSDRTIFMTALSGARCRVAHPGGRWHFWNRWLIPNWTPRQNPDLVVYEQRRQILAACGVPLGSVRFELQLDADSVKWAAGIVPPVAMHVSVNSAKATREWPLENHVQFLRNLWAEQPGVAVLASGSARTRERERLRRLMTEVADSRLKVLPESMSIPQLAAVLARCRLHLGPDSGVLHLAVALGVPTVSFFREQGAYKSFKPSGPQHRVISMPCECVDNRAAPCEALGRAKCFDRISPSRVLEAVREALKVA